jgi:hypothetical protein
LPHRPSRQYWPGQADETTFQQKSTLLVGFKRGSVPPWCTLGFAVLVPFFLEKRLELKSLKRQTKAEELRTPCPELLSLRLSLIRKAI